MNIKALKRGDKFLALGEYLNPHWPSRGRQSFECEFIGWLGMHFIYRDCTSGAALKMQWSEQVEKQFRPVVKK